MDSHPYRRPTESIEAYLLRLNEETSLEILPMLNEKRSHRVGLTSLLFNPLIRCVSSFFRLGGFRSGITSFINAVLAGIFILASRTKIWEYQMRKREGKGLLPPLTKQELERFTQA